MNSGVVCDDVDVDGYVSMCGFEVETEESEELRVMVCFGRVWVTSRVCLG